MLSGGDGSDIKTTDFFSATRSNNGGFKAMLNSAHEKNEKQDTQVLCTDEEMFNFAERPSQGN